MIDTTLSATHEALHRVAVHVVARARVQASGRFSLRVTSAGLGTPEFGPDQRRVRISGGLVVVESDAPGAAVARARSIDGASLRQIAEFAGVDLGLPLDVGHDTPPLGDVDAPIAVDGRVAAELEEWYSFVGGVLDRVVAELTALGLDATLPRLWPEHFDLAIETEAGPGRRVNLGGSPGDGFCAEPYVYVGPWTPDRPGDRRFWNAPFGAFLPGSALPDDDPARAAVEFLLDGLTRLR